jgi:hypothetical protein
MKMKRWAGGVAQAVEYLPSKHNALSSNSSTKKKKKRQVTHLEKYLQIKHLINDSYPKYINNFQGSITTTQCRSGHFIKEEI